MARKHGSVEQTKLIKAGCGVRFDPEQLGDDSGFDFSGAEKLVGRIAEHGSDIEPVVGKSVTSAEGIKSSDALSSSDNNASAEFNDKPDAKPEEQDGRKNKS